MASWRKLALALLAGAAGALELVAQSADAKQSHATVEVGSQYRGYFYGPSRYFVNTSGTSTTVLELRIDELLARPAGRWYESLS